MDDWATPCLVRLLLGGLVGSRVGAVFGPHLPLFHASGCFDVCITLFPTWLLTSVIGGLLGSVLGPLVSWR